MATKLTAAGLTLGLVLAAAGGALAQTVSPDEAGLRALCLDEHPFGRTDDVVIDSCTRLIATGTLNPADLAKAYEARGLAYEWSRNFEEAVADLTRLMHLGPPDAALFRQRAEIHNRSGDFDAAIADAGEAIRLAPDDPVGYLTRASFFKGAAFVQDEDVASDWNADGVWVYEGVWDEALVAAVLSDYAEAIRLAPRRADAYEARAMLFDAMGDRAAAIPDYDQALRYGFDRGNRKRRALAHLRLGSFALAKADLDILLRNLRPYDFPMSAMFHVWRAEAHAGLGEHALAIQDLDEALRLDMFRPGGRIAALNSRARSYQALGQTAAAETDLEQARLLAGTTPTGR